MRTYLSPEGAGVPTLPTNCACEVGWGASQASQVPCPAKLRRAKWGLDAALDRTMLCGVVYTLMSANTSLSLAASTPFTLTIFGASGHLAGQKLYPALYTLALKKRLPAQYAIVGYARSDMDDTSFRALIEKAVHAQMPEVNESVLRDFLNHTHYVQGQYTELKDFKALAKKLASLEGESASIRLAYLSIPPTLFTAVLHNLCEADIHTASEPFRCIVEKPVGHDLQSAEEIWRELVRCFREEEVYLLDHYLGKEAVRNIYYLRFANPILERLFKNTLIHHVEVSALESVGIEERAGYFENTGTLRDMFQSHLLEITALLTTRLGDDASFREARLHALEELYIPPATNLDEVVLQGQYEGYTSEEGVARTSRTNTFATLKLLTRTSRWQGVPFYLRSGKRLTKKETRISIQFQVPHPVGIGSGPNRLDIILQGEAGMRLHLQTKLGGTEPQFRPLILEDPLVCVGDCLPEHGLLILEAIHDKQQWFLSFPEVRAAWRLLDPIQAHLEHASTALHAYPAGSPGPAEDHAWLARDGTEWLSSSQ